MELIYRKCELTDKHLLQELAILSYSQYKNEMSANNWHKYSSNISKPKTFDDLLASSTGFLCEHVGEIVGMAFLVSRGNPTDMFKRDWSYIRMLGVHPKYQGKGIASKLTQLCINHAIDTQENYIALHTSEFMNAARHIYEKFGFIAVKELLRYDKKYWVYLRTLKTLNND